MARILVWLDLSSRKHEPLTLREAANSDASCPFFLFLFLSRSVVNAPVNLSHQKCGRPRAEMLERMKYEGVVLSVENVDHNGTSRRQVFHGTTTYFISFSTTLIKMPWRPHDCSLTSIMSPAWARVSIHYLPCPLPKWSFGRRYTDNPSPVSHESF